MLEAAAAAAGIVWVYWSALRGYLRDQHYQEHFLYLWVFLALALAKSLRGPFRRRFGFRAARDRFGVALVAGASVVFAASEVVGSSTAARTSLVMLVTGFATLTVTAWSIRRCVMHGLLMQLCFGFPYQVYHPLTSQLQWGVAAMLALPVRWGLVDYTVEATTVYFADYQVAVTPDCAGFGQLLTFLGIAALGVLSSARNARRTVGLVLLAVLLAWLSNLARAALFVALAGAGARTVLEDATWHSLVGFAVFLPFVYVLVATILRTHVPPPPGPVTDLPPGRLRVVWGLAPLLAAHLALHRPETPLPEPSYFQALAAPPGYRLELRGPTEASDREAYRTPWLVNVRFRDARDDGGPWFDLLHYATGSHSHLCVHRVAACLNAPGQLAHYADPVDIDGHRWWRIDFDRGGSEDAHVYFAFEIAGRRHDDSLATQWEVFRQRLFGGSWEVRLTRVMLPGRLPPVPTAREVDVLTWLARTTSGG